MDSLFLQFEQRSQIVQTDGRKLVAESEQVSTQRFLLNLPEK